VSDATSPSSERHLLPTWVGGGLLLASLVLVPWAFWLALTLPRRTAAYHWGTAWAGFDLLLSIALALTASALWRRSNWALTISGMAAGMLTCDAWFDVLTSTPTGRPVAVIEAVVLELPLALVCVWLARRSARSLDRTARFAEVAKSLQAAHAIRMSRDDHLP
jgi:Na+/proline symporter